MILQSVYTLQSGFPKKRKSKKIMVSLVIYTGSDPAGLNFRLLSLSFKEGENGFVVSCS